MRRMVVAGAAGALTAAALAAAGLPAGGAAAVPDRCNYSGKRVVIKTTRVAILARSTSNGREYSECHRPSGRTALLNDPAFGEETYAPPAMAVASTTVAAGLTGTSSPSPEDDGTDFAVDRYFNQGEADHAAGWLTLWSAEACLDPEALCRIGSAAVRPNGWGAWISCPRTRCTSSAKQNAVFRFRNSDLSGNVQDERVLLDKGRGIDPRSLRRKGDRIYWTKSGKRRSAAL